MTRHSARFTWQLVPEKKVFFERPEREEGCVRTQGVTSRVSYMPCRWSHPSVTSSLTRPRRSWEGPIAHKGAVYCTLMRFTAVTHKCIFLYVQIMINMCFVSGSWGDDTANKSLPCSDEEIPGPWALNGTNEMIWENGQSHEIIFSLWFGKQYKWVFHQCVNGWNSLSVFNRVYSMRYSTTGGYFSDYITSSAHETLLTVIKTSTKIWGQ